MQHGSRHDPIPIERRTFRPLRGQKGSVAFYWLVGLILSFAHERPLLILTSMDRINPRLFDVMVLVGVVFVLPTLRSSERLPREFRLWTFIVYVFVMCSLIYSALLLPKEYIPFSLFFALKYIECWIAIVIALKIRLTAERKLALQWAIVAGGVYVALYCIYEYLAGESSVEIAPGKFVLYYHQALTGPLGYNYFHIAQYSALCATVTLTLIETARGAARRWAILALTAFVGWPLLFSGSRTGLGLAVISCGIVALLIRRVRSRILTAAMLALAVVLPFADNPTSLHGLYDSPTLTRLAESEGGDNRITNRLLLFFTFDLDEYKWGSLMPLIGGGFYVVPRIEGNIDNYRVGYGVHNSFLFPFEQGGFAALLAFFWFLASVLSKLRRFTGKTGVDRAFAIAVLSYLLASLPAYLVGQIFWLGFETVHLNAFIVVTIMIALKEVDRASHSEKAQRVPSTRVTTKPPRLPVANRFADEGRENGNSACD